MRLFLELYLHYAWQKGVLRKAPHESSGEMRLSTGDAEQGEFVSSKLIPGSPRLALKLRQAILLSEGSAPVN